MALAPSRKACLRPEVALREPRKVDLPRGEQGGRIEGRGTGFDAKVCYATVSRIRKRRG